MKLELVEYKCGHCATNFEAPALGESAYGEFLLRSKNGVIAYLNAFTDSSYKDLDNILSTLPGTASLRPLERAKILRLIYGELTCDFDENNSPFEIDAYPPCPACGSRDIVSWKFKNPAEIVEISVQPVTHDRWAMLSAAQKIELVNSRLEIMQGRLIRKY